MKNLIKVMIAAIVFIYGSAVGQAQATITYVNKTRYVIATSGLNLRSAPTVSSSIIKLVGYGREVELINDDITSVNDTIKLGNGRELTGQWLKVAHRGYKGYMFSPFLAKIDGFNFPTELLDNDFALLLEGPSCDYNFQYRKDFNYTGIYKTVSGKYRAKKVNVTYSSNSENDKECYSVDTDESERLLFIIGSRNTPITVSEGHFSYFQSVEEQKGKVVEQVYYNEITGSVDFCYDNISYDMSDETHKIMSVVWRGDLDADGIDDFIMQYGDRDGKIVLHLSTQTEAGALHKAVAEYYLG